MEPLDIFVYMVLAGAFMFVAAGVLIYRNNDVEHSDGYKDGKRAYLHPHLRDGYPDNFYTSSPKAQKKYLKGLKAGEAAQKRIEKLKEEYNSREKQQG